MKKEIFNRRQAALERYAPPMKVSKKNGNVFEPIGNKPVPYGSMKIIVPGICSSSVVIRKDKVSFCFFPIYLYEEEFSAIIPSMIKHLKGKTCVTFSKPEQIVENEPDEILKKGVQALTVSEYMK
jgi:hypothetical protein